MQFYFKPTAGDGYFMHYPRFDLEPVRGAADGQWYIVEDGERPADSPLYTLAENPLQLLDEPSALVAKPHFKRALRTWTRTRRAQEEIDALIEAREAAKEEQLLQRAVASLVHTTAVLLSVAQALVSASTLGANAKTNATAAITARKTANDNLLTAIQALRAETADLKARTAAGQDVEVHP